jgi:hypothetical protein
MGESDKAPGTRARPRTLRAETGAGGETVTLKMGRILMALLLVLASADPAGATTVTGNLQDLGLAAVTRNALVRFTLQGYGSSIPRTTSGTAATPVKDFLPDSSGNISGTIAGNDTITPGNTYYEVCVYYQGTKFRCQNYQISGASFDLETATPMTGAPAQLSTASPSQTYAARSLIFTQASAATSWVVTHNFNSDNITAHCYNNVAAEVEQPCTVTLTNTNTVTLGFPAATAGFAVIVDHAAASTDEILVGTATGFCSNPAAAPNHLLFTPVSPNAATITPGTYRYVYTLGNENGETLKSAERSVTIGAGEAFQPGWDINAGDYAFTTGCPKMRFYVGTVGGPAGGPYYLQTPRTRKVNLVSITRAANVVTAVTGVGVASGTQHGMVPGDRITLTGVLCGGGACGTSFSGTFELLDFTWDNGAPNNNQLIWAQTGANESGDASTGQFTDINWDLGNSWSYTVSNYDNRGPIFDVPFVTSGTQPPSTNAAVIPALQVALNRTHSRLGSSDPDYFHGRKLKVRLPEKYVVTLTTPLVMYETAIEGVHPPAYQAGQNSPLITSAIADQNLATVMVMGTSVELHGVNVTNSSLAGHAMMLVKGGPGFNGFQFSNGYIGARSDSVSATGAAMRLRNTGLAYNWRFDLMNFVGGRWNIWSDRSTISNAVINQSRLNCGPPTDSGAFRIMGGPDTPERATADADGVTASVWILTGATVTESCQGVVAKLTNSKLIMDEGSAFADSAPVAGTDAAVQMFREFWSEGSSAGHGIELHNGGQLGGHVNYKAGVKQYPNKGGGATYVNMGGRNWGSGSFTGTNIGFDVNDSGLNLYQFPKPGARGVICDTASGVPTGESIITNYAGATNSRSEITCFSFGNMADNTRLTHNTISGMIHLRPPDTNLHGATPSLNWFFGLARDFGAVDIGVSPAATAANLGCRWGWSAGIMFTCYKDDGATPLFHVRGSATIPRINLFNPGGGEAINSVNVQNAIPLAWSNAAANASKRFIELNASDNFILGEGTANEVRPRTNDTPWGSTSFRWKGFQTIANAEKYATATNCASAGGTCGSAAAGAVTIAAAATTVTVATTAVNAASRILIQENSTLGGELGVTCNTSITRMYTVTTVTAATSFVITAGVAPVTNPACLTYVIVN